MRPTQPLDPPSKETDNGGQNAEKPAEHHQSAEQEQHNIAPPHSSPVYPTTDEQQWRALQKGIWERQICVAKWLNWITVGAAAVGFVGLVILYRTLIDTDKALTVANRQADAAATQAQSAQQEFELSERPWISADPVQFSDLTFDKTGGHFTIRFLFKNTGHSPAAHTRIEAQLIPIKADQIFKEPLQRQKQLCDAARNRNTSIEFAAFTLFPGGQTTKDAGMSMVPADIKNAEFRPPNTKERPFIVPIIVGCVDYQFEFARGHHQTGFIYQLWRISPADHFANGLRIYPGDNLPTSRLRFESYAFGGSYAD
jgi:hypothetical protein